jgi:hypothetical protein
MFSPIPYRPSLTSYRVPASLRRAVSCPQHPSCPQTDSSVCIKERCRCGLRCQPHSLRGKELFQMSRIDGFHLHGPGDRAVLWKVAADISHMYQTTSQDASECNQVENDTSCRRRGRRSARAGRRGHKASFAGYSRQVEMPWTALPGKPVRAWLTAYLPRCPWSQKREVETRRLGYR